MIWLPGTVEVIYIIAQVVAGIAGVGVFIFMLITIGFNSEKTSGDSTVVLIGANFIGSMLAAFLSVFPVLVFETQYHLPKFPTEFFLQSFWLVYAFILIGNVIGLFKVIHRATLSFLLLPVLGLVAASWVAKTIGVTIFVFESDEINWFLKIVFVLLDLALGALYLALPGIAVGRLAERGKKAA